MILASVIIMKNNNDPNDDLGRTDNEYTEFDPDRWDGLTESGQPIHSHERYGTGPRGWTNAQIDKHALSHNPSFPAATTAQTSFHAMDAPSQFEGLYNRLFLLQHGRQHPYERVANGYSEGWSGQKVRIEHSYNVTRARTILSNVGVGGPIAEWVARQISIHDLQGFSRYYEGVDGAAIGFATLAKYDDVDMAKESYLATEAETYLGVDGEKLIEYVWRKYGGDQS